MSGRLARAARQIAAAVALAVALPGAAGDARAQTTRPLVTNFTLLNISPQQASGVALYYKDNATWGSETFTMPAGSQLVFRQAIGTHLGNPGLTSGRGAAVVIADQPLAGVVQIRAVEDSAGQNNASSGAYLATGVRSRLFYVPLVARKRTTVSGPANGQIVVQNVGNVTTTAVITLVNPDASVRYVYTTPLIGPGSSFYYDLEAESATNVPDGWFGSAVVRGVNGPIGVVANFFTGSALQTFNVFPEDAPTTRWYVPLFAYKLANGLSTPVAVQNLSSSSIPTGSLSMSCTPATGSPGAPFTTTNVSLIRPTAAYYFNPVVDSGFSVSVTPRFYGPCIVESPVNVVVFVQMRFVVGPAELQEAAAYEAFPLGTTARSAFFPVVAKRLSNGFATAVSIQNLDLTSSATFTLTYLPAGGGSPIVQTYTVAPGGSLIHNHRIESGPNSVSFLPNGWQGGLAVESNRPVAAFAQLTFLRDVNSNLRQGDHYMAHNALLR